MFRLVSFILKSKERKSICFLSQCPYELGTHGQLIELSWTWAQDSKQQP